MRRLLLVIVAAAACRASAPPRAEAPSAAASASPRATARIESIAGACTKIASCAHEHDPPRERDPAACVDWWVRTSGGGAAFAACIDRARGCADVDACLRGRGDPAAAAFCSRASSREPACDGTRLVVCSEDDPRESTSVDCAALHGTCGEVVAAGGLLTRGCISAQLCPQGAPPARCDGPGAIVSCHDGVADRTTCVAGETCEEQKGPDGSPIALCESPAHARCDDVGKRRCDGDKLVECVQRGATGEAKVVDCGELGLACDPAGACVLPGGRECDPRAADGAPRCEGDALVVCAAGKRVRSSCSALGFAACDPDGHGVEASCKTE